MEYEEVVVYDFFSSSPLKHRDWMLLFQILIEGKEDSMIMSELRLEHSEIVSELKKFYVAITRARTKLIIYESNF